MIKLAEINVCLESKSNWDRRHFYARLCQTGWTSWWAGLHWTRFPYDGVNLCQVRAWLLGLQVRLTVGF